MGLDSNYSVSAEEKNYVKTTLETEWVQALFQKEASWLQSKIINNFHSTNYSRFEQQKVLDKSEMKDAINKDPDMKAKYEAAFAKHGKDGGFSEGILLLQTLAIKCITVLKNDEVVEEKLKQRSELGRKSDAMDGIIGPNTFYVLASIAKDQGISFDWVIDQKLIDKIVDICLEDEPEEKIQIKEKIEPMPKAENNMNITQNAVSDETMEARPIITPKEKFEPMPKAENNMIISQEDLISDKNMATRPIIKPREKIEAMPKADTNMNIPQEDLISDENMETRPIIKPEEKLEAMPKAENNMNITQNTVDDENMETRPIITPEKVEIKESNELQINDFFDPITDWTDKIAPRVKSENMGNRMVRETARNRTDKERNKDSEKFIENWVKEGSIIIDIWSALWNTNPLYAGITTQELYNNENILNKTQGNIIAVDLDDRGNKEIRDNNVKNKKAYNIKVEWVDKSLWFMTPVEEIVKKYGTEKNPIIIRSANWIDMLMTEEEALKHLEHIASSLKNYEVTYVFNKYILYKTNNSTKFSIIGEVNEAGFDHKGNKWITNKDRTPYILNEKWEEMNKKLQTEEQVIDENNNETISKN